MLDRRCLLRLAPVLGSVYQHLLPDEARQQTDRCRLERVGPVRDDDVPPAADLVQDGPRHRRRVRRQQRRAGGLGHGLLRAPHVGHPDPEHLDVAALQTHLPAECLCQFHEIRFAGRVRPHERHAEVRQRPDVDDQRRRAALQPRDQLADQQSGKHGVDAGVGEPARGAQGLEGPERAVHAAARAVYQNREVDVVEAGGPVGRGQARPRGEGLRRVGDEGPERAPRVRRRHLGLEAAELVGAAAVQDNVEAAGRELVAELRPDAARGAGDQGPRRLSVRRRVAVAVDAGRPRVQPQPGQCVVQLAEADGRPDGEEQSAAGDVVWQRHCALS